MSDSDKRPIAECAEGGKYGGGGGKYGGGGGGGALASNEPASEAASEAPAAKINPKLLRAVFMALFAALIAVTCIISIQVANSPVPIVLQNLFAVLAGTILGGFEGAGAVAIFLFAGALGLPVFSGGTGGIARLVGPTGGYLIGYFLAALVAGIIMGRPKVGEKTTKLAVVKVTLAGLLGFALIYLVGTPWLAFKLAASKGIGFADAIPAAISAGVLPFMPGCLIKLIILVPLTLQQRRVIARYISPVSATF